MMNNQKEWKAQSTVTIPLEYYEWLRNREDVLKEILINIRNCFDFESEKPSVNVDKLVKVALETTDEWFDGVVENIKDLKYLLDTDLRKNRGNE